MINAAIPMQFQGFDVGPAIQNAQQMKLRDMMMQQQREEFDFRKQQYAAQQEQAGRDREIQRNKALAQIVGRVTDEATYQRAINAARNMGYDTAGIPPNYDPEFVAQKKFELELASDPEKLTAFQQELAGAGIMPGSEEYAAFIRNKYAPVKYVVDQGYGYTAIDPMGGAPQQSAPPPPPPGFVIDGEGAGSNVSGGFPGS